MVLRFVASLKQLSPIFVIVLGIVRVWTVLFFFPKYLASSVTVYETPLVFTVEGRTRFALALEKPVSVAVWSSLTVKV